MATSLLSSCLRHVSNRYAGLKKPALYTQPCAFYRDRTKRRAPKATPKWAPYPQAPRFPEQEYLETPEYPPVKPRYPPTLGKWDSHFLSEEFAWKLHDEQQSLKEIPNVKERLEKIAGSHEDTQVLWKVTPFQLASDALKFNQYISKTHILPELPSVYCDFDVTESVENIRPIILDSLVQYHDQKVDISSDYSQAKFENLVLFGAEEIDRGLSWSHNMFSSLFGHLFSYLSGVKKHILRSQFDENVRVESFWKRSGYKEEEEQDFIAGIKKEKGILTYQYLSQPNFQIRTELPIPEFAPSESELCKTAPYPSEFTYPPNRFGSAHFRGRPITVAGHWIEDPCQFHQMSIHMVDSNMAKFIAMHGLESSKVEEKIIESGMMAGFGSCLAQAHNVGFNHLMDLTYPITSQVVITDGQWFQFFAYQLNTLMLWKNDTDNPVRNLMWASERMKLFEKVEGHNIKGFNDGVLEHLLKFMALEPVDRGVELRPNLPEEMDPANQKLFINHIGTEPLEQPKIGRYQYPKNAVYF